LTHPGECMLRVHDDEGCIGHGSMRSSRGSLGFNMQLDRRESCDASRRQIEIRRKTGTQSGSRRRKPCITWSSRERSRAQSLGKSLGDGEQGKWRRKEKRFRPRATGIPSLIAKRRPAWRPSIGGTANGRAFSRVQEGLGDPQAYRFVMNARHDDRVHSPNRSPGMELCSCTAINGSGITKEIMKCFQPS
jgi:hypothetical protein